MYIVSLPSSDGTVPTYLPRIFKIVHLLRSSISKYFLHNCIWYLSYPSARDASRITW